MKETIFWIAGPQYGQGDNSSILITKSSSNFLFPRGHSIQRIKKKPRLRWMFAIFIVCVSEGGSYKRQSERKTRLWHNLPRMKRCALLSLNNNQPHTASSVGSERQHNISCALLCRSCLLIIRPRKVPSLTSICTLFRHAQTGLELWCRQQAMVVGVVAGVFGNENCFCACKDQSADGASKYN